MWCGIIPARGVKTMTDKHDEHLDKLARYLSDAADLLDMLTTTPLGKIIDFEADSNKIEGAKDRLDEAYKRWRAFWNV